MRPTMTILVHNTDQSQPMVFTGVDNTYVKEGLFCIVNRKQNEVMKFPIANIFRVTEPYAPDDHLLGG